MAEAASRRPARDRTRGAAPAGPSARSRADRRLDARQADQRGADERRSGREGTGGGTQERLSVPGEPRRTGGARGGASTAAPRRTPARLWNAFLRNRSVRVRVLTLLAVPLLAASLLGGLLLGRAVQDALRAQRAADVADLAQTALLASQRVQDERDTTALTGVDLTSGIEQVRAQTDEQVNALLAAIDDTSTTGLPDSTKAAIDAVERRFGELETVRTDQDYQQTPFDTSGVQGYVAPVRAVNVLLTELSIVDPRLSTTVEGLGTLSEAAEAASQERGLTAWVLNREEPALPEQVQTLLAIQRSQDALIDRVYDRLPAGVLADFRDGLTITRDPVVSARLIAVQSPDQLSTEDWYQASSDRLDVLRGTQSALMDDIVESSADRAETARLTAILTLAGLVLVLIVAVVLTLAVARSIVRPLRILQAAALRTAQKDLPELVERVREEGPRAVQDADSGLTPQGQDEIARVAAAFNEVHATAVRVTGEQALLRQNLDSIVVNLSRRTQSLVDRQLREIETLEGSERDPDQLATLFRIDHLATRVQRHAESLLVLAGVDSSTKSPDPVPLLDVVRAAAGEVEQYERVRFGTLPTDLIAARAVDDVAHLVAELLDNATEFSPPATTVLVDSERLVGGSLRVTVTDQGLGVPAARLAELNERLTQPGEIDVAASRTLGLYVVARLARRHGIVVRLEAQSSGGTVARIDIPASIVEGVGAAGAGGAGGADDALVGAGAGSGGGWTPALGSGAGDAARASGATAFAGAGAGAGLPGRGGLAGAGVGTEAGRAAGFVPGAPAAAGAGPTSGLAAAVAGASAARSGEGPDAPGSNGARGPVGGSNGVPGDTAGTRPSAPTGPDAPIRERRIVERPGDRGREPGAGEPGRDPHGTRQPGLPGLPGRNGHDADRADGAAQRSGAPLPVRDAASPLPVRTPGEAQRNGTGPLPVRGAAPAQVPGSGAGPRPAAGAAMTSGGGAEGTADPRDLRHGVPGRGGVPGGLPAAGQAGPPTTGGRPAAADQLGAGDLADPLTDPRLRVTPESLGREQAEGPIYSALRSSWFRRAGADPEAEAAAWSSPADEGWRQVAEVTRRAESINESLIASVGTPGTNRGAASAFAGGRQGSALPRNGTAPAPEVRRSTGPVPVDRPVDSPSTGERTGAGAGRTGDVDTSPPVTTPAAAPAAGPAPDRAVEPSLTEAGLPVRQRGASLVPGAIAAARAQEGPRDAAAVRSTLSTLVTGVARGRDERTEPADDRPQDRTDHDGGKDS